MNTTTEKTNAPNLAGSEALSETAEAISPLNLHDSAAANDSQDPAGAPCGEIRVCKNWAFDTIPATAPALADWCRNNPAPDVKPEGTGNAPNLGFLFTPAAAAVPVGHPKLTDVAYTHGCQFDLDKEAGHDIALTLERAEKAGLAAVFWESHSSTEAEPKGRLLVILDPPCPADKHAAVYEQLRRELCPKAPKGQHNTNRGWNPPRAGAEVVENEGRPVDWREVIARAPKAPEPKPSPTAVSNGPVHIGPSNMEFAIRACQSHPPGQEDGNASANLLSLGCKLILGCGLDLETAVVTALRYYDPRCTTAEGEPFPWGEAEIRRAFAKAGAKEPSKGQAQWRAVLDSVTTPKSGTPEYEALVAKNREDQAAEIAAETSNAQPAEIDGLYSRVFRPLAELPAPKPLSYVCEGLLIARDVRPACFVCYPGVGKSTAGVELARAVATGTPAFGQFACQKGRVLFIANEGGRGAHDALLRHVPQEHRGDIVLVRDTLLLAGPGSDVAFALMERAAREFDLIVLDSLNSSLPGLDENDARTAEPLGRLETLLAADNGARAAMVVLRHTGKASAGRKDPMQVGRGTSAIDGRVSVQWLLEPVGDLGVDRSVDWQCTRANDADRAPARPFNVALRDGKFEVRQETGKQAAAKLQTAAGEARKQSDEQLARAAIQEAWWTGGRRAISQRDAEQIAIARGLPGRVGRRALEQLVVDGANPATRGDHYAYRLAEKGPVLWGVNPGDSN